MRVYGSVDAHPATYTRGVNMSTPGEKQVAKESMYLVGESLLQRTLQYIGASVSPRPVGEVIALVDEIRRLEPFVAGHNSDPSDDGPSHH